MPFTEIEAAIVPGSMLRAVDTVVWLYNKPAKWVSATHF